MGWAMSPGFRATWRGAAALYEEALALRRHEGQGQGVAWALHNLAATAQEQGVDTHAITLNDEALVLWRSLSDRHALAYTLANQAVCLRLAGDLPRATALLGTLLPLFEELGDTWGRSAIENELGRIAYEQGHHQAAVSHLHTSMRGYRAHGDRVALTDVLQNWAAVAAVDGHPEAVRLLAAVEALTTALGHPLPPGQRKIFLADVALARRLLGADTFDAQWTVGQALTLEGAIDEVLALHPRGEVG
jgi:hypothetical protein